MALPLVIVLLLGALDARAQADDATDPAGGLPQAEAGSATEAELQPVIEATPEGVESISVTGERLDEADVQDEAQAISAFNFEELDRANITNVDGLAFNVPSLHIGQQGNQAIITLRGIGTQNASITGEPGVQFHVDGINYARPSAARVAFFDLAAVQVHRGPYGTSGGKNATGGAIEVTTRKPSFEFETDLDVEWGSERDLFGSPHQLRTRGALNVPLIDEVLAGRFAFIRDDRTGYQENLTTGEADDRADDADSLGLRGHLRFTPTDTLDVLLSYNYYKSEGVGPGSKLITEPGVRNCPEPIPNDPNFVQATQVNGQIFFVFREGFRLVSRPQGIIASQFTRHTEQAYCAFTVSEQIERPPTEDPDDPRKIYVDVVQRQDNVFWGWSSSIDWQLPELPLLGEVALKALGGFQGTRLSDPRDFDATDIPFFTLDPVDSESWQYSGELRLESVAGEKFDWLAGVYYQRETSEAFVSGSFRGNAQSLLIDQNTLVKTYGVFGETKLYLTDSVTFSLGARYNRDFKDNFLVRASGGEFADQVGAVQNLATCLDADEARRIELATGGRLEQNIPECSDDWGRWSGGVALEWRPTDDHLLYTQFDKGYKAGGFVVLDSGTYKPETVKAVAVGSKSFFFDGRLMLNLEAYNYRYRDYQVVEIDGISIRTESAPRVRVRGVDVELEAEPFPGLRLNGQLGYLDAEFREYRTVDPLNSTLAALFRRDSLPRDKQQDLGGSPLARSPQWSYTLGAEYSFPIGRWGSLTPRVQYYWQDETFYRAYGSPLDLQEDYHVTDVKLIWNSPDERWSFEAYVANLEDADVFQNLSLGSAAVGSPLLAQFSAPRTYGFRVGFKY
jgi:iron complex outermembrane receptor protein